MPLKYLLFLLDGLGLLLLGIPLLDLLQYLGTEIFRSLIQA